MHNPHTFASPVSAELAFLAGKLKQRRVILLLGAGVSRGDPSSLPLAPELAQRIYTAFKDGFAAQELKDVPSDNLPAVADAIASYGDHALRAIRQYLASEVNFDSAQPNHAHRVLVSFFAEGLMSEAMTTNYDTCVERAGASLGEPCIAPCRSPNELQTGGEKGRLLKLHGCVTDEATILITTKELEAPDEWILASVVDASAKDTLVIVGINSVAPYVEHTLKKVWAYAEKADSVWIVSPSIDPSWDDIIGPGNESPRINATAEGFLDELLHGCLNAQLGKLRQLAEALDANNRQDPVAVDVIGAFVASLGDVPVLAFVMALRSGLVSTHGPLAFVISDLGLQVLYALSLVQLATGAKIEVNQVGDRAWLQLDKIVVNFAHGTGPMTGAALVDAIEGDLRDAKARGLLAASVHVLAIASGFVGPLPGGSLPPDIVGDPGPENIIDGPDRVTLGWLSLSQLATVSPSAGSRVVSEALP